MAQNDSGSAQLFERENTVGSNARDFSIVSHQEADGMSWLSGFLGILF